MKKFFLNVWYTILYQFEQLQIDIPAWWYEQMPFDKQPLWMQRVSVAKDVIEQLDFEKYRAKKGSYVGPVELNGRILDRGCESDDEYDVDVQSSFENVETCQVCALGACIMSITRFKNKLKWRDLLSHRNFSNTTSDVLKMLTSIFEPYQLAMIECAFEGSYNFTRDDRVGKKYCVHLSEKDDTACKIFYYDNGNSTSTLKAIMQNIIDNKGTFKP